MLHRKPTPHELALLIQRRLEHLPETVAESKGYMVLPGVPELLRQLSHEGHLLGIITGNGDGAAHIKLARGDLNRWFTLGAYAGAGLERADIVRVAVRRGEGMLGQNGPNTDLRDRRHAARHRRCARGRLHGHEEVLRLMQQREAALNRETDELKELLAPTQSSPGRTKS